MAKSLAELLETRLPRITNDELRGAVQLLEKISKSAPSFKPITYSPSTAPVIAEHKESSEAATALAIARSEHVRANLKTLPPQEEDEYLYSGF